MVVILNWNLTWLWSTSTSQQRFDSCDSQAVHFVRFRIRLCHAGRSIYADQVIPEEDDVATLKFKPN